MPIQYERCERCGRRERHWLVWEWRLEIGEIRRKPHLCQQCTDAVEEALLSALKQPPIEPAGIQATLTARDVALQQLEQQWRAEVGTDHGTDYTEYRRGLNEAFGSCADDLARVR